MWVYVCVCVVHKHWHYLILGGAFIAAPRPNLHLARFAKHFIGFFVNYMRFLGRIGPEETKLAYGLMIGATWGTSVALFIHTLKFKGYIGARTGASSLP